MNYVDVPKDLSKVKTKFMFNLTKRQVVCFGIGAAIGIPLFFLLRKPLGNSTAAMLMIFTMLPAFLFAMYEKNGQPLEIMLRNMIRVCFLRPKRRVYRTNNYYSLLEQQAKLDEEVYNIVFPQKAGRKAGRKAAASTDVRGKKADPGRNQSRKSRK